SSSPRATAGADPPARAPPPRPRPRPPPRTPAPPHPGRAARRVCSCQGGQRPGCGARRHRPPASLPGALAPAIHPTETSMKIEPYLFFDGQAEEAMAFYEKALGAQREAAMRYADCPEPIPAEYMPPGGPQKILHGSLIIQGQRLMLSDGVPLESGGFRGFSLA